MANLPTRNNNPGDLRDPSTGSFKQFSSPQEGHAALLNDLTAKMTGTSSTGIGPASSLAEFSKVYAPPGDNNNSAKYAADLANKLGVSPATRIGELKHRIGEFADAIGGNEGYQGYNPKPFSQPKGPPIFNLNTTGDDQATTEPKKENLGDKLKNRMGDAGNALSGAAQGKINPISGLLQGVGAGAGAVNDVVGSGLGLLNKGANFLTGGLLGKAEDAVTSGVGKVVHATGADKAVSNFQTAHPELSKDIGAVGNIVGAAGVFTGASALKGAVGGVLGKALGKDALGAVIEDVAPNLTSKTLAKSVAKKGTTSSLIKGEIKTVADKTTRDIAQTVVDNVPSFSKLKTFSDKLNAVKDTVSSLAEKLKADVIASGQDRIYPFKELAARMKAIEPGIAIKADPILERQFTLARDAALKIAQEKGGTVSSLFDARKAFDDLVEKQFPTLYERANAPMRDAITSTREAMNKFIEEKLPKGSGFRESLRTQSKLFRAIDNMAPKAAKEIGSTRMSRFAGRHPVVTGLVKKTTPYVAGGLTTAVGIKGVDKLLGN